MKDPWNSIKNMGKLLLLAAAVGILAGAIDALFGRVLLAVSAFRDDHISVLLPILPAAGLLIILLYQTFSPLSQKGMTLVFEAGQNRRNAIPLPLIPLVMIGTWLTHLFGGSAGREGVAVQIGGTLAHGLGRKFCTPAEQRVLLIAGMAAGFSGLFQTPLTAVFFSLEVLIAGELAYEALLPALLAAGLACKTSALLGLGKFSAVLGGSAALSDGRQLAALVVLGLAFGLTGRCFSTGLQQAKRIAGERMKNPYLRIGVGAIPLTIVLFLLHTGRYCGLGTNLIQLSLSGGDIFAYDWLLKLLLTVWTLSLGFQGGEVTPLFAIGSALGAALAPVLGLSPALCAGLGYAAVFGSATNTLIAPMLIGLEVFGGESLPAFVLVCAIAYCVNGNRSIYGSQLIHGEQTAP